MNPPTPMHNDVLPAWPQVSFDIGLRKVLERRGLHEIDFDMPAYLDRLRSRGLDDQAIAGTTVFFGLEDPQLNGTGSYLPYVDGSGEIELNTYDPDLINRSFTHETEHRIDHALGRIAAGELSYNRIRDAGIILGIGLFTVSGIADVGLFINGQQSDELMLQLLCLMFTGVLSVVGAQALRQYLYDHHSTEVRARAAAAGHPLDVISLS